MFDRIVAVAKPYTSNVELEISRAVVLCAVP